MNEPHGGGNCFIGSPSARGRTSGSTKYQRNICTSSGTLRKSSTYTLPSSTTQRLGVVRSVPTMEPSVSAITHADSAVASVQPSPVTSHHQYAPVPSGAGWKKMAQFQL